MRVIYRYHHPTGIVTGHIIHAYGDSLLVELDNGVKFARKITSFITV